MDMITLALAKKYTDERVGNGGSSGGGSAESKIILDMPIDSSTVFSGMDIPLDAEMGAVIKNAAENQIPVCLRFSKTTGTQIKKEMIRLDCVFSNVSTGTTEGFYSFLGIGFNSAAPYIAVLHYTEETGTVKGSAFYLQVEE